MSLQNSIESKIRESLAPTFLHVENESRLHSFNPTGESHFKVVVVSGKFEGLMLLKRHRLVQETLKEEIAALRAVSLHTLTPAEWEKRALETLPGSKCAGGGPKG